ncbi:MAG: hypothetical protein PSV23_15930 [Brevundimonas sp.]|uniref:hypothetical protein n=1 Tax=Brevundimonas sp. TaxID=1871086 RepID=UPI0024888651|nr:hypothetical protein [Brevundimonas sp.]MDI1328283.1 hypothetical protein [Brevundimonas sp.]
MNRADIELAVGAAIEQMVLKDVRMEKFSFSFVPSKARSDGGLGAGWNAWHILLNHLRRKRLSKTAPFTGLVIDPILVDTTLDKDLRSLRYQLTERLVLIDRYLT